MCIEGTEKKVNTIRASQSSHTRFLLESLSYSRRLYHKYGSRESESDIHTSEGEKPWMDGMAVGEERPDLSCTQNN